MCQLCTIAAKYGKPKPSRSLLLDTQRFTAAVTAPPPAESNPASPPVRNTQNNFR